MKTVSASVAVVIVWYNPTEAQISTSTILAECFESLWIIDNSLISNRARLCGRSASGYYHAGRNVGIAAALNMAFEKACATGHEFIVSFDQDSTMSKIEVYDYVQLALNEFHRSEVSVIGCRFTGDGLNTSSPVTEVRSVICSGSIYRLSTWAKLKGFDEGLFIDEVDHDYCYRVRELRGKILLMSDFLLQHEVGEVKEVTILGKRFFSSNHEGIRRYYQTRNSLYVSMRHFGLHTNPVRAITNISVMLLLILLVENDRMSKLKYIFIGVRDFCLSRYGALEE
jgi:rhamnosyltransferase